MSQNIYIVGFNGQEGIGKDTFVDAMLDGDDRLSEDTVLLKTSLAWPLRACASALYHFDPNDGEYDYRVFKEEGGRELLVDIAENVVKKREGKDFFAAHLLRRVADLVEEIWDDGEEGDILAFVPDFGFPEEVEYFKGCRDSVNFILLGLKRTDLCVDGWENDSRSHLETHGTIEIRPEGIEDSVTDAYNQIFNMFPELQAQEDRSDGMGEGDDMTDENEIDETMADFMSEYLSPISKMDMLNFCFNLSEHLLHEESSIDDRMTTTGRLAQFGYLGVSSALSEQLESLSLRSSDEWTEEEEEGTPSHSPASSQIN